MKIRKEIGINEDDLKQLVALAALKKRNLKNYIENLIHEHLKSIKSGSEQENKNAHQDDGREV